MGYGNTELGQSHGTRSWLRRAIDSPNKPPTTSSPQHAAHNVKKGAARRRRPFVLISPALRPGCFYQNALMPNCTWRGYPFWVLPVCGNIVPKFGSFGFVLNPSLRPKK